MEQLVKEARELADQGVKELILVAQETTLYGVGSVWGEEASRAFEDGCASYSGDPVDPSPVLLSRRRSPTS